MDLQFDGLIIESHNNPDLAWSDKDQQITPDVLSLILNTLVIREMNQTTESLAALRKQIDEIDMSLTELLAKRMRVAGEIGQYKKEHGMAILQATRYDEILSKRIAEGEIMGMSGEFMKTILEAIHTESVRKQMEIMNK
jgi:chorismate mutase